MALAAQVLLAHPLAGESSMAGLEAVAPPAAHHAHCEEDAAPAGAPGAEACPFHCALGAPALDDPPPPFVPSAGRAEPVAHRLAAATPAPGRPPLPDCHGPRAPPSMA